jgi:hypothetical protein
MTSSAGHLLSGQMAIALHYWRLDAAAVDSAGEKHNEK